MGTPRAAGVLVLVLYITSASGQIAANTVDRINGISWADLQRNAPGALPGAAPTPYLPLSQRTIYNWGVDQTAAAGARQNAEIDSRFAYPLVIEGRSLTSNYQARLINYAQGFVANPCAQNPTGFRANTGTPAVLGGLAPLDASSNRVTFNWPYPSQYRIHETDGFWLCLNNQMTNILVLYVPRCVGDSATSPGFDLPGGVGARQTGLAGSGIPQTCAQYAALNWSDATIAAYTFTSINVAGLTATQLDNTPGERERKLRTRCCGQRPQIPTTGTPITQNAHIGMCYNPTRKSCCTGDATSGTGKPYVLTNEKCCFGGQMPLLDVNYNDVIARKQFTFGEITEIRFLDSACPCRFSKERQYCGNSEACCKYSKFSELVPTTGIYPDGLCYDPTTRRCCDDGSVYDPGSYQCCSITGLQKLENPCPCTDNTHCGNNQTCCIQQYPALASATWNQCNKYFNYPNGQLNINLRDATNPGALGGAAGTQFANLRSSCPGTCIDTRYQMCCNGQACFSAYDTCCNNTCCNKYTSDCTMSRRAQDSSNNYGLFFETCTQREALLLPRAVLSYFLPIIFLVATFLGLAFTLFFAKRFNSWNPLSSYEKTVYALAFFTIVFATPLFFSPLWKYGLVIVWIGFFTILAALAGVKTLLLVATFLLGLLILYLVDPFQGNELLQFAPFRINPNSYTQTPFYNPPVANEPAVGYFQYNGVLHTIQLLFWDATVAPTATGLCTDYYLGFFTRDATTEDQIRYDNPYLRNFGFCSRGWVMTMAFLVAIDLVLVVCLFFATLIAQLKNVLVKKVLRTGIPFDY